MARILYSLLLYLLSPCILIYLYFIRGAKNSGYRAHFAERLGFGAPRADVIIHCASVGEVMAATPLIKSLQATRPQLTLLITCNTPTGRERIVEHFKDSLHCCYLPLDLPGAVKRFLKTSGASTLCILETELWPNLLITAKQQGMKTLVINARLSKKSLRGYLKVAPLSRWLMASIDCLACHHSADAVRFKLLGADPKNLTVTGSVKFDIRISEQQHAQAQQLRVELGEKRPVWIAGSTHPGEHEQMLEAHKRLLKTIPDALLILVPRHPEQFGPAAELIEQAELEYSRRSQGFAQSSQVLLGDTMGELTTLYGCADIAFIGGSLIERGGHNPLEASAFAIPVLCGPSFFNFQHIFPTLTFEEGAQVISSAEELAQRLRALFTQPEQRKRMGQRGLQVVKANQGAVEKTLLLVDTLLDKE